jgi:hypothetical protein
MLAEVFSVLASVAVLVTCGFVAMQTAEARKTRLLMEAENAPLVRVFTDYDPEQERCCVRIKNFGKSPAKDITISPTQPWGDSIFLDGVPFALSGQRFTLEAGQELVPVIFQSIGFPDALSGHEVTVVYHEGTVVLRQESMSLNTKLLNGLGTIRRT